MPGKLSEDRIRRVVEEADRVRLVMEYVGDDGKGRKGSSIVSCRCPMHDERSPSFIIYVDPGRSPYHCYGCGWHGDQISLVREKEGLGFREAVEWLERWGGIVPLLEGEAPRPTPVAEVKPEDEWQAIMPIPESAMASRPLVYPCKHEDGAWHNHRPSRLHPYKDAEGRVWFYTYRLIDLPKGMGKVRPLTWCQNKAGAQAWKWLYPSLDHPLCAHGRLLYGLDQLAAKPDAIVVVCEGEKDVDAAQSMIDPQGLVAVGSSIGAWNASKTDWRPLRGRRVLIWPDANDPAGAHFAYEVTEILRAQMENHPATDGELHPGDEDLFA